MNQIPNYLILNILNKLIQKYEDEDRVLEILNRILTVILLVSSNWHGLIPKLTVESPNLVINSELSIDLCLKILRKGFQLNRITCTIVNFTDAFTVKLIDSALLDRITSVSSNQFQITDPRDSRVYSLINQSTEFIQLHCSNENSLQSLLDSMRDFETLPNLKCLRFLLFNKKINFESYLETISTRFTGLKRLEIHGKHDCEIIGLENLLLSLPKLENLVLKQMELDINQVLQVLSTLENLKSLELSNLTWIDISLVFQRLGTLKSLKRLVVIGKYKFFGNASFLSFSSLVGFLNSSTCQCLEISNLDIRQRNESMGGTNSVDLVGDSFSNHSLQYLSLSRILSKSIQILSRYSFFKSLSSLRELTLKVGSTSLPIGHKNFVDYFEDFKNQFNDLTRINLDLENIDSGEFNRNWWIRVLEFLTDNPSLPIVSLSLLIPSICSPQLEKLFKQNLPNLKRLYLISKDGGFLLTPAFIDAIVFNSTITHLYLDTISMVPNQNYRLLSDLLENNKTLESLILIKSPIFKNREHFEALKSELEEFVKMNDSLSTLDLSGSFWNYNDPPKSLYYLYR